MKNGPEITDELLQQFTDRFINYGSTYGAVEPWSIGYARFRRPDQSWQGYVPLTLDLLRQHVAGSETLYSCSIDADGATRFIGYDDDTSLGYLATLENELHEYDWHTVHVVGRPGRAGHLFVLFDKSVPADDAATFSRYMLQKLSIPEYKPGVPGV